MTLGARFIQIELTTVCQFDCFYCAGRAMPQQHMDNATFERILEGLTPDSGLTVSLQGEGEPTLHPQFWDMVQAVRQRGHAPCTITNGVRVDAERFAQNLSAVGVSVDTVDAQEAERIGRHNLPKVLANLAALLRTMGPQRVTVHTVDLGQPLAPLRAHLQALGVQKHAVQPLQAKDDYARRYPAQAGVLRRSEPAARRRCAFLSEPLMRYFNIDGVEMPCCFIKDASVYRGAPALREALAAGQIPPACAGCRQLR